MKIRVLVCAVALLGAASIAAAPGAAQTGVTLVPSAPTVTWTGTFSGTHPLTPVPEVVCARRACEDVALTIALGSGYWIEHPRGAVEVAVHWVYDGGTTDLDLIVTGPDGTEKGRSSGLDSDAESVFLHEPADGTYTVTIVPVNTFNPETFGEDVTYRGLAQVELAPTVAPLRDLLPNFISFPPSEFHIASALNQIPFPENPILPCYPEETLQNPDHPTKCLRFNQLIANVGDGRLELRFDMRGVTTPDAADDVMLQRIYLSDGTYRERAADRYEFHAVHAHIHYRGFGGSFLYPYGWGQGRTGPALRVGNKVGFCVIDGQYLEEYWGKTGNGPRLTRQFPDCNLPENVALDGPMWMVQGIDVGWADLYTWNLADQYIDITGIADGVYELEQVANPTGSVIEQTRDDNAASTVVCLRGDTVSEVSDATQAAACLA